MRSFFLVCLLLGTLPAASAGKSSEIDPQLQEIINKIDARNQEVQRLKANFVERRDMSLLKEPIIKKGVFYLDRELGVKFEFEPKEDLILVVSDQEMVSLSPEAGKAARIPLKKRRSFLAHDLLIKNLRVVLDYFKVSYTRTAEGEIGRTLTLTPTKRKAKKKVRELKLWFDETFLISKVQLTAPDGDVFLLELSEATINPELDAALFSTDIPEEFELSDRMDFLFGPNTSL
ncbi:LolA family protein [Acanthopleuribacter pedis]|uniref:Outer membrane lipoprotein carrier protein LolA n=1 Tax=Acanthopleuribacter pedis TaxID=442870 RepID=A0A8J7QC00_9BACT|nr:outer membrane lipoprotein carrier protein LolA [Acanthopleuribacter pedis]MBO1322846.1 outer membrane lipoprotein carrier protein LolA [Acanthopleuribacter pedis]